MRKIWILIFIVSLGMWRLSNEVVKVTADSCVVGPGVYCAADSCGVWYQPPNNCSTTNTHCDYYNPDDLPEDWPPGCTSPPCDPPKCGATSNCKWDNVYDKCKINQEVGGTSCQYCYDQSSLCTCTDAYGTEEACCVPCSDGSGCDGSGGGSPTPTPSAPPACTPTYPEAPTPTSPANGSTVYSASATLEWQAPSDWGTGCPNNDNHFLLNVIDDDTGHYLTDSEGNPYHRKVIEAAVTSETVPLAGHEGHEIGWRVIASNGSYENQGARMVFNVAATVAGRVYLDADNTCSTSQPSNFGGLTARLRGTSYSDSVGSDGEFGIISPPGTYTLDMTVPSGYICSSGPLGTGCGGGCPSQAGVSSPSNNNNFFFTQKRSAWWQAEGGDVYAGSAGGGTVLQSLIPVTVPEAERNLILGEGLLIYRSGNVALGDGGAHYKAKSAYKGKRYDFDFWKAHIGVDLNPRNDWGVDSMGKPSFNDNKKYYWLEPSSGTAQLANDWQVASGEKYIVLIDGNLRINHNLTVANGGFLAFMVKGNVTIDPSVSQVEGIYILDGRLVTSANSSGDDVQLQVGGTVVAWTGVELHRDLGAGNLTQPAEKFSYRLDLIENMPEVMRNFLLHWKEVPAGTFGE